MPWQKMLCKNVKSYLPLCSLIDDLALTQPSGSGAITTADCSAQFPNLATDEVQTGLCI